MPNRINLIYLLGAGRSGTTLLATLLNNHHQIETLGEMHQFYEFLDDNKNCSCGEKLINCNEWSIPSKFLTCNIQHRKKISKEEEAHRQIPKLLLSNSKHQEYLDIHEETFKSIHQQRKSKWYVDSSKYIARFLLLKKSKELNVKGIYLVRDSRGVVHSFQKKVQTSKTPLNSLLYYNSINFFAEWVYRTNKNILKIKYEDLVEKPEATLAKIYTHIFNENVEVENLPEYFKMPHIVGGNRMKSLQKIKIKPDTKWKSIKRYKQILYYFLSFPFVSINKNKL